MTVPLSLADATDLGCRVLVAAGATEANARPVAEATVAAEAEGVKSHGLTWLTTFADHLKVGKVDGRATPRIERTGPAAITVDARAGFAHPAIAAGIERLIPLARETGIAAMAVRNSYNCLMVSHHVGRLAAAGLVALGFVNAPRSIAAWGGKTPVFGTNPMAFACPRRDGPPMILDQASSKVARSEIRLAMAEGRPIPLGWALDAAGNPTTDAAKAMAGSVLPFGDYKGYGIALMVDLLAGGLSGARFSHEADAFTGKEGGPPGTGQFFIAIDPVRFGGPSFPERVEKLLAVVIADPGVHLPGDRRRAAREKVGAGPIRVPKKLFEELTRRAGG